MTTNMLGDVLRKVRYDRTISQRRLARMAGVPQAVISRLECGDRRPSWELFCRLLHAMELEPVVTVKPRLSVLEREIDRVRSLTPAQRWEEEWLEVEALADQVDGALGPDIPWALDDGCALVGHGVPIKDAVLTIAVPDTADVANALAGVAEHYGQYLVIRPRTPMPPVIRVFAGTRDVPVVPVDHVVPSSEAHAEVLAVWSSRLAG